MNIPFKFETGDLVKDLTDDNFGVGQVVNAYVQWNGDVATTVYSVDFAFREDDDDPDEDMIFDRYVQELEPSEMIGGSGKKTYLVERIYTLRTYMSDWYEVDAVDEEAAEDYVAANLGLIEPDRSKDYDCDEGDDVEYETKEK